MNTYTSMYPTERNKFKCSPMKNIFSNCSTESTHSRSKGKMKIIKTILVKCSILWAPLGA